MSAALTMSSGRGETTPTTLGGVILRSGSDKCRPPKKLSFKLSPEVISSSDTNLSIVGKELDFSKLNLTENKSIGQKKCVGKFGVNSQQSKVIKNFNAKEMQGTLVEMEDEDLESQAMRIVRTVGQAFEVCHKLVGHPDEDNNECEDKKEEEPASIPSRGGSIEEKLSPAKRLLTKLTRKSSDSTTTENKENVVSKSKLCRQFEEGEDILEENASVSVESNNRTNPAKQRPSELNLNDGDADLLNLSTPATPTLKNIPPSPTRQPQTATPPHFQFGSTVSNDIWAQSMGAVHEVQFFKEKLEQQQQQTQAALAQINLLRDQLAAESSARIEAQARTHQLLLHNKELLDHLQSLVRHIQELEGKIQNNSGSSLNNSPVPALPQASSITQQQYYPYPTSPSTSISFQEIENLRRQNASLLETMLYEQNARNFFSFAANAANSASTTPGTLRLTGSPFSPFPNINLNPYVSFFPPPPSASSLIMGNPSTSPQQQRSEQILKSQQRSLSPGDSRGNYATVFTAQGEPLDNDGRMIRPLGVEKMEKSLLSLPPSGAPLKLGTIGRNASADETRGDDSDTSSLKRIMLGRSVSEKLGHKSELMENVQRTAWARHTTK